MNNKYLKIQTLTESEIKEIINTRRHIHANPEIGFYEFETAKLISKRLKDYGYKVIEGVGKTGVVGLLKDETTLENKAKTLMLRADMDALPIQELINVEYKSKKDGLMHACGHDGHVAVLLAVCKKLMEMKNKIPGQVKVVFQPAEEGLNGAKHMINDGVLENPKVDNVIGLHIFTPIEMGKIGVSSGGVMASVDEFKLKIIGKGGHGAFPEETKDPIVISANIINTIQTIVSRNIEPLEPAVVTFGTIKGGSAFNIIPATIEMTGTVRTFNEEIHDKVKTRFETIINGITKAYDVKYELEYKQLNLATVNDAKMCNVLKEASKETVGEENIIDYCTMGGEDMSEYLSRIPGCFFFVGCRNEAKKSTFPHHSAYFNIDEDSLIIAAETMIKAVEKYFKIY